MHQVAAAAEDWPGPAGESLRDRRRRELRQQLSDVATRMFLEHGFDAVRVADIARACGVTQKTVFNHFRSKESLLADRWDAQTDALRAQLADSRVSPVDAVLAVLERELDFLMSVPSQRLGGFGLSEVRRFSQLIRSTPSLVAHNREALDRLTAAAAAELARRAGTSGDAPGVWITAVAITGLWSVYALSLDRNLALDDAAGVAMAVRQDLQGAAAILRLGIS